MWPFDRREREQARIRAELEPDRLAWAASLADLRAFIEANEQAETDGRLSS